MLLRTSAGNSSVPRSPLHSGQEYKRRTLRVVKGDTVKLLRGDAAGTEGLVDEVHTGRSKLIVQGISIPKADGTEVPRPVDPSNVQITKLNMKDPKRVEKLTEGS